MAATEQVQMSSTKEERQPPGGGQYPYIGEKPPPFSEQQPGYPGQPGQPYPGQPYPGQPYAGQQYPGQQGQPGAGQPYYGQVYTGQPYAGQPITGQQQYSGGGTIVMVQATDSPVLVAGKKTYIVHIVLSCCVFWCCFALFGLIAFVLALLANKHSAKGDIPQAEKMGKVSLGFSIVGIVLGIVVIILIVVL